MSGIKTTCKDSPTSGRTGCGAKYSGELQHCVAKVPWSTHPDGLAHITASLSTIELMWRKGGNYPAEPSSLGLILDVNGIWRQPMSEERREMLEVLQAERKQLA